MAGRDKYKRVITADGSIDDSQHCLLNNTLQCSSFHYALAHLQSGDYVNVTSNSGSYIVTVASCMCMHACVCVGASAGAYNYMIYKS